MSKWQPIATAPKDGNAVDLWSSKGYRYPNAAWDIAEYAIGPEDEDGYGWTDTSHHGSIMDYGPFTHWMPLPAPPATP